MKRAEKNFFETLSNKLSRYQTRSVIYSGFLGKRDGTIEVPGLSGYVYIRMANGEVLSAFNQRVPNIFNLPIYFGYDPAAPKLFQVLSIRPVFVTQPNQDVSLPEIPDHNHTWPARLTTWVRGEQFLPGLVQAKGGMTVCIYPFYLRKLDGTHIYVPYTELDLTSYVPAEGSIAILIAVDNDGDFVITSSASVASIEAVTEALIPVSDDYSLAGVRMSFGMSSIRQEEFYNDIFDLRFGRHVIGGATWGKITGNIEAQIDLLVFSGGHTHGTMRWLADGGTTYNLTDFASSLLAVYSAGSRVDPTTVELSSDGAQVIFSVGPTAGNVLVSDYIIRSA
jgi:hypothetical protein